DNQVVDACVTTADATSTSVSLNPTTVSLGGKTTVTTTVADITTQTNPKGTVTFSDGNPTAGGSFSATTCNPSGNDQLTCISTYTSSNTAGSVTITASYIPSASNFKASSNMSSLTVILPLPSSAVGYSNKWAGYVVQKNLSLPQPVVTMVTGSWIIPSVPSSNDLLVPQSVQWIGIGGLNGDQTLIQIGTESDSDNPPQYYAFYELGKTITKIPITVNSGDIVSANISCETACTSMNSNTIWKVTLNDLSTHTPFSQNVQYSSSLLSADWIVERHCYGGFESNQCLVWFPLSDFGTTSFNNAITKLGANTASLNNFDHWQIVMTSDATATGIPQTLTSSLDVINGDFSVTWLSPNVSVQSANDNGPITFTTSNGGFTTVNPISQSSLSQPPPAGSYPLGFFSWSVTDFAPATSVTLTITYHNPIPSNSQYLKLIGGSWVSVPVTISGNTVTMTIVDNGPFDANPTTGIISDPGGLLVATQGRLNGDGKIRNDTNFNFEVRSGDDKDKINGHLEYYDKSTKFRLESDKISFLSVDTTTSQATFMGQSTENGDREDDKKTSSASVLTFLVSVADRDKTGIHDIFTITVTDSYGRTVYVNSGTVSGHIEIHKLVDRDDKSDNENPHDDNSHDKNPK
ncbi:MAG: hypothetical protein KGI19_10515, partial [Thaumarchaeota archaeon]|nr:hypothetical protein [Nitrososphaerota archaeon]